MNAEERRDSVISLAFIFWSTIYGYNNNNDNNNAAIPQYASILPRVFIFIIIIVTNNNNLNILGTRLLRKPKVTIG